MADESVELSPDATVSAQEIDEVVSQFRLFSRRLSQQQTQKLLSELPRMTEADLAAAGHQDDVCPICFNTLIAILAEEEFALAMDSPAHHVDELGVTKLQKTCGHIFCRKDIMKWITEGHDSCPNCRQLLFVDEERREDLDFSQPEESWLRPWLVDSNMVVRDSDLPVQLPTLLMDSVHALGVAENSPDRHDLVGMYS